MTPRAHRRRLAAAALAAACAVVYLWMLFAWESAGDTAEPWLSSEIHLTRAPDAPAATHNVSEKATRPSLCGNQNFTARSC